jgi:hypothetical protein
MLLSHPHVKHIISQKQTTINFQEIMKEKKILLVKLSFTLPSDIKKFIGTILLSELTHAALTREDRTHFCIYVDEVQNFATSEDFATLFTQARKFFISTVISHQERYGQFADNKKMQGATAAAVNKIFFQTTVRDAEELAPEFTAKPPPAETRHEQELVISKEPVWTLLSRGHTNPEIQEFVYQFLTPIQESIQQIKEEIERTQLVRMNYQDQAVHYRDQASMYGVDDKREGVYASMARGRDISVSHSALSSLEGAFSEVMAAHDRADGETVKLMALHERFIHYRQRIRSIDKYLTGIMEGRIMSYGEDLAQFYNDILYDFVDPRHTKVLLLYHYLLFGDRSLPRSIPAILAAKHWPQQLEDTFLEIYQNSHNNFLKKARRKDIDWTTDDKGIAYYMRLAEKDLQLARNHYRKTDITFIDGQPISMSRPLKFYDDFIYEYPIPLPDLPPPPRIYKGGKKRSIDRVP